MNRTENLAIAERQDTATLQGENNRLSLSRALANARAGKTANELELEGNRRTARAGTTKGKKPIQVASGAYRPEGYLVDFFTVPSANPPLILTNGQTFYIQTYYSTGNSVTFEPGCTIKYKNNAYMFLYGTFSFPDTLLTPVFTSRNDDGFGEKITGIGGETDSDGNPANHKAFAAIYVYSSGGNKTIKNAYIRWAQSGIQLSNNGTIETYTVTNCRFEKIQGTGTQAFYLSIPNATLQVANSVKWNVDNSYNSGYSGTISGNLTTSQFGTEIAFPGMTGAQDDAGSTVADTMGAIGPYHYFEILNGRVKIFQRGGNTVETQTLNDFFGVQGLPVFDPRVAYDHFAQRWIVCAAHRETQSLLIRVSYSNTPTLQPTNWRPTYNISIPHQTNYEVDFPTLGLGFDGNGYYISIQVRTGLITNGGFYIQALKKPDVFNGTYTPPALIHVEVKETPLPDELRSDTWAIQPAVNFDSVTQYSSAWLVAKGRPKVNQLGQPISHGGEIYYNKLNWTGGAFSRWRMGNDSGLDLLLLFGLLRHSQNDGFSAIQGPNVPVKLGHTGSRLMMAQIRNGNLYTCHHVGLDGEDAVYNGGNDADRSAIQWVRFEISGVSPANTIFGPIYDSSVTTSPYGYYFPSLAVDPSGNMVIGFSGSKNGEFVSAFYTGRDSYWQTMPNPVLIQAGRFSPPTTEDRWGDYSHTTIDPTDGSFWTVQEYGFQKLPSQKWWGTWISRIKLQ